MAGQSARLLCGYVYADAGHGESTTDMTFAAHNLIAENGTLLCEAEPFANGTAVTELDLGRMVQERILATRPLSRMPPDTRPSALIWKWQKHR